MGVFLSGREGVLRWEARVARLLLLLGVGDVAPVVAGVWSGADKGV